MLSVGIDVSKGKSTIAVINELGEVIESPKDYRHQKEDLDNLVSMLNKLGKDNLKIVMESTGVYHRPVLYYLKSHGFFVSSINPLKMKKYLNNLNYRGVKTDKVDSLAISQYGIDNWFHLKDEESKRDSIYDELRRLERQYLTLVKTKAALTQNLDHIIDQVTPGINSLFSGYSYQYKTNHLADFLEMFWHYDLISKLSYKQFKRKYDIWVKKKGYKSRDNKPAKVYELALNSIPTIPPDETTKFMVLSSIKSLRNLSDELTSMLTRMDDLAKQLKEYEVVKAMPCVGETLRPLLIAEIGDITRFHSADSLIAYAGIDVPPYQSGQYDAKNRHITRKGSSELRKLSFQVVKMIYMLKPQNDTKVLDFIIKKKEEGKPHKVCLVAGMNKFLRIYYARVKGVYSK